MDDNPTDITSAVYLELCADVTERRAVLIGAEKRVQSFASMVIWQVYVVFYRFGMECEAMSKLCTLNISIQIIIKQGK